MAQRYVPVLVCLNDPGNGEASGHALGLDIMDPDGEAALELRSIEVDRGPVCRIDTRLRRMKLGPFWFHIKGHKFWVGNWCWDAVWMEPSMAADLLNKARASDGWTPDAGYEPWWERWMSDEPFAADDFVASAGLA